MQIICLNSTQNLRKKNGPWATLPGDQKNTTDKYIRNKPGEV